jgi:hypothetical protein
MDCASRGNPVNRKLLSEHLGRCGDFGLTGSRVALRLRAAEPSQVRADPLRAWLPNVQPGADGADRRHPSGRYLTRKLLSRLRRKRVTASNVRGSRSGRRSRRHLGREGKR